MKELCEGGGFYGLKWMGLGYGGGDVEGVVDRIFLLEREAQGISCA